MADAQTEPARIASCFFSHPITSAEFQHLRVPRDLGTSANFVAVRAPSEAFATEQIMNSRSVRAWPKNIRERNEASPATPNNQAISNLWRRRSPQNGIDIISLFALQSTNPQSHPQV
jgi:hypothetical protein